MKFTDESVNTDVVQFFKTYNAQINGSLCGGAFPQNILSTRNAFDVKLHFNRNNLKSLADKNVMIKKFSAFLKKTLLVFLLKVLFFFH